MRRINQIVILLLCIAMLGTVVHAESSATKVENWSSVTSQGSCEVTLTVSLYLDTPASNLTFPLPDGAENVTMNSSSVRTYKGTGGVLMADLSKLDGLVGNQVLIFRYSLDTVLKTVDKTLMLEMPLLCGFDYPVDEVAFSITLPGDITTSPKFISGYMQEGVDSIIKYSVGGSMITGSTTAPLQDRDTLTLTMVVTEEMFPGQLIIAREGNPEVIPMGICAALALVYWLVFMRCLPIFRQHRTTALEGVTAGEIGSHLTSAGADLTMMVFSWAQLGYLQIQPDKYGRVILRQRMEMGNERTDFENRCFKALFAKGRTVDATGTAYARLCQKVARSIPGVKEMYRRRSGNIRIFRYLACGVSLFSGICFAMNLTYNSLLRVLLAIVLAVLGITTAWGIQDGMYRFHIRGKTRQYVGTVCMLVWLLLGLIAGQFMIAFWAVLAQVVTGLAAAYGGRRSELGRYQASQILGLRHYLRHIPQEELNRIVRLNPDYFFEMLPYAIALGVDTRFAKAFGNMKLPSCTYLTARENPNRTAAEWALLMRKTADKMDKRQRKMELGKWMPISIRRK